MEADEEGFSSKWVLVVLVAVALLVLIGIGAALAIPLQPSLRSSSITVTSGTVIMPAGVGNNVKLNFYPAIITVIIGQNNTVTWDNQDATTHTVTSTDNSFNSGDIKPGTTWTYTFSSPGNFSYYCIYHSAWMRGTVIVKSG